jgi:hypothetical protein
MKCRRLVDRGPQPGVVPVVDHRIQEHHAFNHPSLRGWLSKAVVGLSDPRPQRLVVDVEHPPAVEFADRDGGRKSTLDERFDEVGALLSVDDASEAAVLALDEHARVQQHIQQEARLALSKPERGDRIGALFVGELAGPVVGHGWQFHLRSSSAMRGCREPARPRPPPALQPPTMAPTTRYS